MLLVGILLPKEATALKLIGDIFLRLIQMSIVILVLGQIIEAVGNLESKALGSLGLKTIAVFLFSSFSAAFFGLMIGELFQPGKSMKNQQLSAHFDGAKAQIHSFSETILDFFPKNIISSLAEGTIVQIIVFALLFGLALHYYIQETKNTEILNAVKQINQVILKMMTMIMSLAPIGIFAIMASTIGKMGIGVIMPLVNYLLTYAGATFLFLLLWLIVIQLYTRVNLFKLIKKMIPVSVMALATTSSAVTLPVAIEESQKKLGIRDSIVKLVLPLGMSLNSNGSAMHMSLTILTIAQMSGIHYSLQELCFVAGLATLASLANAVVPGAGLVSLTIVVPQMGLPIESIALFAGVEWFVGMLRTILNVDSDIFSALIVAKSEKALDTSVYRS